MARHPRLQSATLRPRYAHLAELLRAAISSRGVSTRRAAIQAGFDPSLLSQILRHGEKRLSRANLVSLASVLQLDVQPFLAAAGYDVAVQQESRRGPLVLPRRLGLPVLHVVTDPRFVDSALFFLLFSDQPFSDLRLRCELRAIPWHDVPDQIVKDDHAIGFFNRQSRLFPTTPPVYWTDLCLYRGYALLARPNSGLAVSKNLTEAKRQIRSLKKRRLRERRKPVIVSMGADTTWRLNTPLTRELQLDDFEIRTISDADFALDQFLAGVGDFYIGGLPQRMRALKEGCVNVLDSSLNPLFFSLNSLVASPALARDYPDLLAAVTALWFSRVPVLTSNEEARSAAIQAVPALLRDLGINGQNVTEESLRAVLTVENGLEVFPANPSQLVDEVMKIAEEALSCLENWDSRDPKPSAMAIIEAVSAALRFDAP